MKDIKRFNMVLGILAVFILVTSCAAFAYTLVPKGDADKVVVGGVDFTWDDIADNYELVSFSVGNLDFEGYKLTDVIEDAGIDDPEDKQYKFIGIDGYEKDVDWEDVESAYLVLDEKKVVFTELVKAFWVKDLVTIDLVCVNCEL